MPSQAAATNRPRVLPVALLLIATGFPLQAARATPVEIVAVALAADGDRWRAEVTLRHADSGWKHYADGWRIVDGAGRVLVHRTLLHPHVDEQPFTRGDGPFSVPAATRQLFVEARDNVDGWSAGRLAIDLDAPAGDRYRVQRR